MTHVHVAVERNIKSAVGEINKVSFGKLDEKAEPQKGSAFFDHFACKIKK